jgi:RNA polymerase sigma-70 factor, ECF subfamily
VLESLAPSMGQRSARSGLNKGYVTRTCEPEMPEGEKKVEHYSPTIQGTEPEIENASVIFKGDYQRIFRYIVSMVRDTAEAEDLTQETFLRAYQRRDSLRDVGAQTAWLYRIATHVCLDRLRQYARRSPKESSADLDDIDVAEPDTPSLQQTLERDEMSECVQRYLNRLSDSYRAVILLHDMHELTAAEIAQLLGESLATIKIRLHRARRKLSIALQAGCEFSHDERDVLVCESKD